MYAARTRASAPNRTPTEYPSSSQFAPAVEQLARRLRVSVLGLDDADRHLLQDIAEGRYPMKTFCRLMAIAKRSNRTEDRFALAELVRRECMGIERHEISLVFDAETIAQGPADVAAREYERHPSSVTWQRAVDAFTTHFNTIRVSLDALLLAGPALTG
jgi:hypothetical protein